MVILPCDYYPKDGSRQWYVIHWSAAPKPEALEAELARRGLQAERVYIDKSGSYWIPLDVVTNDLEVP